ncbi:dTDP-4-dehydrorhamnose reductase family protein [Nitrococcus mobilis]|uniref:dTDP-4-dehydrorhamnose reductase n=1 Tax=Nitrococcus mobilis Nb-231 TaxID=314278 RepID=A4BMH5_9GAMM|nr:SDR family oxidoreductase [Nitrococcus mobilis]EAR23513.1 hypothetical protein NB231_16873 [Nitrococcus mobilis Nb-231]
MRVLILGVTGMLGSAVFRVFEADERNEVWGTMRDATARRFFPERVHDRLLGGIDVLDQDALAEAQSHANPDLVINCVGLIKQRKEAKNPLRVLPINAMLPHRLARLCALTDARLIHVSTDCVFSGGSGRYAEADRSDAEDLYGKSKFIGELHDSPHAITLRTSIIGHELSSNHALVDWFLSQENAVKGYTNAVFSGLPTVELARVMRDFVAPRPRLHGLYHVAARPIDKFSLLTLIAEVYGKKIEITPDDKLRIDRSLISERFTAATGYVAPEWPDLVRLMYQNR